METIRTNGFTSKDLFNVGSATPLKEVEGKTIEVTGKIVNNSYKDGNGNERESMEIEAADIVIIADGKAENRGRGGNRDYDEEF